jgi:8-oxo-dGTP pyrophosphatase MutT (NUDIX family)
MTDGKYVVLFNMFDPNGRLQGQQRVGTFTVENDAITATEGIVQQMLPKGQITVAIEQRIEYCLNNGYYAVKSERSFTSTIKKSEAPYERLFRSLEAVNPTARVNNEFEVPGLAGYSLDGNTVYIDRRLPKLLDGHDIIQFLLVHEITEKALIDRLGFSYEHAHELALRSERRAVELAGLDWNVYDHFMQHWIRELERVGAGQDKRPPDLDPSSRRTTHNWDIRTLERPLAKSDAIKNVASVAVISKGRVLMGRRRDNNLWTMPGGGLNPGEQPLDGAKRELFEETGVTAKNLKFLGDQVVAGKSGKPIHVYSYALEGEPQTRTDLDPDQEVQKWNWIDCRHGLPLSVASESHVPPDQNVTLKCLKIAVPLRKADPPGTHSPENDQLFRDLTARIHDHKHPLTNDEITWAIRHAHSVGEDFVVARFLYDPMANAQHAQEVLGLNGPPAMAEHRLDVKAALRHNLPDEVLKPYRDHIREYHQAVRETDKDSEDFQEVSRGHHSFRTILTGLAQNHHLDTPEIDEMFDMARYHHDTVPMKYLLEHPKISPEKLHEALSLRQPDLRKTALSHPNMPMSDISTAAMSDSNGYVREHATQMLRRDPEFRDKESVQVSFGTNRARQVRDIVAKNGGQMSGGDLKQAGIDLGQLGLGSLKNPDGSVSADAIQRHIDQQPKSEFGISHSKYGFDPDNEDYADENHPFHEDYDKLYQTVEPDPEDEYAQPTHELIDDVSPLTEQRHSNEPSQVLQVNLTPEKIKQMQHAGVWDTFKRMQAATTFSRHPAAPHNGLGWVRYTEKPDGIFIDEIQSDLGQSFVKQAAAHAKQAVANHEITPEQGAHNLKMAEAQYPEEHYQKIKNIVFGGKHPSEVIHEAFHQHLRDTGKAGMPIHMWQSPAKARMSLKEDKAIPAHMQVTYDQNPKKMGYEPAQYGEISTQPTKPLRTEQGSLSLMGEPTWKTKLRKSIQKIRKSLTR